MLTFFHIPTQEMDSTIKSSHIEALEIMAKVNYIAYNITLFHGRIARINPFTINDPLT